MLLGSGKKDELVEDIPFNIPGITVKGGILGGGGKIEKISMPYSTYQPTIVKHEPYEVFAPQLQFAPVSSYAYQGGEILIGSPGASVKKALTQDVVSKPSQTGTWDIPLITSPHYEQPETRTTGLNVTHIAIIAVIGAAGIMLIKKKK